MIDNYARAYTEIYSIIDGLDSSEKDRIPTDEIIYIKEHMDNTYNFKYNSKKTLKENNISKETAIIFVYLCKNYLIEREKQEVLEDILKINERIIQNKLYEKYNRNKLSKEIQENFNNTTNYNDKTSELIVYEDNLYRKVLNILRSFFKYK